MAMNESLTCITVQAGADLSAKQFLFVDVGTGGQLAVVASAGADCIGVLQNAPAAAGRDGQVAIAGVTKVLAGGTVTAGDKIQSDANGAAITAATTAHHVVGKAMKSAVAGDYFEVLLGAVHHVLV